MKYILNNSLRRLDFKFPYSSLCFANHIKSCLFHISSTLNSSSGVSLELFLNKYNLKEYPKGVAAAILRIISVIESRLILTNNYTIIVAKFSKSSKGVFISRICGFDEHYPNMLNKLLALELEVFTRELQGFVGAVIPLIVIVIYTDNYKNLSSSGFVVLPNSVIIMDFRKFVALMDEFNKLDEEGHKDAAVLLSKMSFIFINLSWARIIHVCSKYVSIKIHGGPSPKRHILTVMDASLILTVKALGFFPMQGVTSSINMPYLASSYDVAIKDENKLKELDKIVEQKFNDFNVINKMLSVGEGYKALVRSLEDHVRGRRIQRKSEGKRLYSTSSRGTSVFLLGTPKTSAVGVAYYGTSTQMSRQQKQRVFWESSALNNGIKEILNSKEDARTKQLKIEALLNEQWLDIFQSEMGQSGGKRIHGKSFGLLMKSAKILMGELNRALVIVSDRSRIKPLFELSTSEIVMITFQTLLPILQTRVAEKETDLVIKIGNHIWKKWGWKKYVELKKINSLDISFKLYFLSLNITPKMDLEVGSFVMNVILNSKILVERHVMKISKNETVVFIEAGEDTLRYFDQVCDVIGFHLPLVCPPDQWRLDENGITLEYGGYLLNKSRQIYEIIIDSVDSRVKTKIVNSELISNTINLLSSVPFRINRNVLKTVVEIGVEKGLLLDGVHNKSCELNKLSKHERKAVLEHNSRYFLEKNIIGIAEIFANEEMIFFPVKLDWRGRIYTIPDYLSFQGIELAKALLEFSRGEKIIPNQNDFYFKVYGASVYGLDRFSFDERVKWVNEHDNEIISVNFEFWSTAKEPLIFLAFCYEYKDYVESRKTGREFYSHLPIQLDATCNGIQHLSSMIGDEVLAKKVNLLVSSTSDRPSDLYHITIDQINKEIEEFVKENPIYARIKGIKLTRDMVKKSIMTLPYNITVKGVYEYLKEYFEYVKLDPSEPLLRPKDPCHGTGYINYKELYQLARVIHSTLFITHPKLKVYQDYLNNMVQLLVRLNLAIIWLTPSGLMVAQKYVEFKSSRVKPSGFKGGKTYTITIPTENINRRKQVSAFMPNLIHSMDAATIALLINRYIKLKGESTPINIFTIHDCFASTAPSIYLINELVRESFIQLYSNQNFIPELHNFILSYIEKTYRLTEDGSSVIFGDEIIPIPAPPTFKYEFNLLSNLLQAKYFIH